MLKTILHFWKLNLYSALEYRTSFFMQVFFMMLNNTFFFIIWVFFFKNFKTIGGMTFEQYVPLLCLFVLIYAFLHIFFFGYEKISMLISEGWLDGAMLLPRNLLVRLLIGSLSVSAIGDLFYGYFLMYFIPNLTWLFVVKLTVVAFLAMFVFLGFLISVASLAFFFGNTKELLLMAFEWVLGPAHYPPGIFEGSPIKFLFMTVLPVFFVAYFPYSVIMDFSWMGLLLLVVSAGLFMSLGFFVFYSGLKRYESGNIFTQNG